MATIALMLESDGPGGAETMLLHLADELRCRGHEVVPVGPANGCGWLAEEFRLRGYAPEVFHLHRAVDWRCVIGLAVMLRRRRVDVIHSHEFTMAFYGAAAARLVGAPHVVTMHGGMHFAERRRRQMALRWALCRSRVVAVSESMRARLVEALGLPASGIEVVPNGIAFRTGERTRVRAELGLVAGEWLILAVGNLYPVKGHIVLLRALAALRTEVGLPWRVAIAGRGGEEGALRSFAREHGIGERLHLLGYRSDVPDLLAASDIYVMPSLSEGLPMALLEAMSMARPIVASEVGGIPDVIVSGEHGILVPPGDPQALITALRRLLATPGLGERLAAAARQRALESFGVRTMTDRYEAVYGLRTVQPRLSGPAA